jgi:hypothetical protein
VTRRRLRLTRIAGIGRRSGAVRISGGRFARVIARDETPVISLDFTPPASAPAPRVISKSVIDCPCCNRWLLQTRFEDGRMTVEPFTGPLGGDDPEDVPF